MRGNKKNTFTLLLAPPPHTATKLCTDIMRSAEPFVGRAIAILIMASIVSEESNSLRHGEIFMCTRLCLKHLPKLRMLIQFLSFAKRTQRA